MKNLIDDKFRYKCTYIMLSLYCLFCYVALSHLKTERLKQDTQDLKKLSLFLTI